MRKWHISDDWMFTGGFVLLSRIEDARGESLVRFQQIIEPIEKSNVGVFIRDVGLPLTADDAQQLMNELWRVGMRPRDGAGSLAHVEATRAHLEDLRKLVFEVKR